MSKKRIVAIGFCLLLLVIVAPVVVAQFKPKAHRSLTGVRLADVSFQDVGFRNDLQNIELAGMLFVPETQKPHPVAVVIHGSGTSKRDNRWYLTMVDHLVRNDIAVLLPDKRGSEQSGGDWQTASFEDLATDTLAAIGFLGSMDHESFSQIGIIGLSQGGQIAPVVASQSDQVEFLVSVVGGAGPISDQLLFEENRNLQELGLLPGISWVVAQASTQYLMSVSQKDLYTAIGDFNNIPYWQQVSIPALALYGEDDSNVDSVSTVQLLSSLQLPNLAIRTYAGSGHALEDPQGEGDRIFRQDALQAITNFIRSTGK